ncbi:MAG: protein phosphatase 2C domain-containing protein [Elusimicrobiota bacterium]|jgi:protein phosphatase|nr:protein phosphatase 2C domain-containing protein [Elusimicrobiota bacterium]
MEFDIELGSYTDIGKIREKNEDSVIIVPELCLCAVADGMGGHNAGEVASNLAVSILRQTLLDLNTRKVDIPSDFEPELPRIARKLLYASSVANLRIHTLATESYKRRGMGTTLSAIYVEDAQNAAAVHIGDSRIYLLRGGKLSQISLDHSYVMEQVARGLLTKEEADKSRIQNILTKALGLRKDIKCDVIKLAPQVGDVYMLCSDGVNKGINDAKIEEILGRKLSAGKLAHAIVKVSAAKDGKDNVSAAVMKVLPKTKKPLFRRLFSK